MSKKPSLSRTRGIVIDKKYYRAGAKYLQIRLFAFSFRILTILSPRREPPFKKKTLRFPQNNVTIAVFWYYRDTKHCKQSGAGNSDH